MVERNTFVDISDGDQLNQGYFNGIGTEMDTKKIDFLTIYSVVEGARFIIGHSADTASYNKTGEIVQTTDYTNANITWTTKNSNVTAVAGVLGVNCKADRTAAVALESVTADGAFTSNSGATWSDTTTNPPNVTAIYDLSCPTTTLAVAFGDNSGAGENIWRSTNGGDDWAEVTDDGAGAAFGCGDMFDGTTGFAIPSAGTDIFITSDSAVNWADSNRDMPVAVDTRGVLFALSATVYIVGVLSDGLYKGTTSANPTRVAFVPLGYRPSKIVKTTNGNLYCLWAYAEIDPTSTAPLILMKSIDSGDTWTQSTIYAGYHDTTDTTMAKFRLSESADNKLIFVTTSGNGANGGIIEIDVS